MTVSFNNNNNNNNHRESKKKEAHKKSTKILKYKYIAIKWKKANFDGIYMQIRKKRMLLIRQSTYSS